MLDKKDYEKVKAIAAKEGLSFWAFTARALTAYIRAKTGEKVELSITTREEAQSSFAKLVAEHQWHIVDMLLTQPMLASEITTELKERGFALGRTALTGRLKGLTDKGLIRKKRVGHYFGKDVHQWALVNTKKAEQWLDENDPYA